MAPDLSRLATGPQEADPTGEQQGRGLAVLRLEFMRLVFLTFLEIRVCFFNFRIKSISAELAQQVLIGVIPYLFS